MADAGRRKAIQPAHASNLINYGHFGTASYNDVQQRWSFLRQPQPIARIEDDDDDDEIEISPFKLIRQPVRLFQSASRSTSAGDAPERISTTSFLNFASDVAAVATATGSDSLFLSGQDTKEPLRPSLLAFGSALVLGSDDLQSGFQTVPIAARVNPAEPEKVMLMLLGSETVAFVAGKVRQIQVPRVSTNDSVTWKSHSGPVRQVCFSPSHSAQEATWMAIRQARATTILQPLLHRAKVTSGSKSSLDSNVVVSIPISRTGGLAHADVVFHPQDSRRVAIVDIGGNWSVWRITGTRSRSVRVLYRAHLDMQGHFATNPAELQQFDGWHKTTWLSSEEHDVDRLFIANRESFALFDFEGSLLANFDARIGLHYEGWILDVLPSTSRNQIFVLTASHIFCMATSMARSRIPMSKHPEHIVVQSSCAHFRGHGDLNLMLGSLAFSNGVWLFLFSTSNSITTAYRCLESNFHDQPQCSISDPIIFTAPTLAGIEGTYLGLHFVASSSNMNDSDPRTDMFFKYFSQIAGGDVYENLYQLLDHDKHLYGRMNVIPLPNKHLLLHKSDRRIAETTFDDEMDYFIVEEDEDEDEDEDNYSLFRRSESSFEASQLPEEGSEPYPITRQLLLSDFQGVYAKIAKQSLPSNQEHKATINTIIATMERSLENMSIPATLLELIAELPSKDAPVPDVETDSHQLENWVQDLDVAAGNGLRSGRALEVLRVDTRGPLIDIYDDFVDLWISSLSSSIPDRIRVQKERLSRHVALDVYLSSIIIRPVRNIAIEEAKQLRQRPYTETQTQTEELPDDSLSTSPGVEPDDLQVPPKPPTLLDNYTTFRKSMTVSEHKTALINDVLAHLPTSSEEDPDAYSYADVELNLALTRDEIADRNLDSKARRKADKLARARKRQLDKQTQLKKVAVEQSTAPPMIVSSQLPIRAVQSSQGVPITSSQYSIGDVPQLSMTQPERGAFGKRDAKNAKSKGKSSRQKGF